MNQQPTNGNDHWNSSRWEGITRPYTPEDVARLSGTVRIDYTLARNGAGLPFFEPNAPWPLYTLLS